MIDASWIKPGALRCTVGVDSEARTVERAAEDRLLLDQQHPGAGVGGIQRCLQPRGAGSDHSDIDKEEGLVVVFRTKLQVQHTEAGLDTVDAAGGGGDIEVVVCKARTDAVVDYHALLIGHQSVTRAPHRLLGEGEGVESVEKFGGIRAAHVEATEGGYINQAVIISQDTDGMTHPAEIDMGWAIAHSKPFFVGKRSLESLEAQPPKRKLVGFTLPAVASKPLEGHLVLRGADISGNVTSCEYSQTLGQIIGLAYAGADQSTPGSQIPIRVEGGEVVHATVVTLPFFDPDTQRQEL